MTNGSTDYLELSTPTGDTIKVLRQAHPRAAVLTVTSGGARVSYPEGTIRPSVRLPAQARELARAQTR
jgi:hypothetical protein